jgi:uncharacterized protein (TIRG00374 family)
MNVPATEKTGSANHRIWWLKLVVSLGILAVIITQVDLRSFANSLLSVRPEWLFAAVLAGIMDYTVTALVWRKMLSAKGLNIPFTPVMRVIWISNFFGFVTPSSMGSDIVKVVGLGRYMENTTEALSSLTLFRLAGYVILFLMAAVSAFAFPERIPDSPMMSAVTIALACGAVLAVVAVVFSKWVVKLSGAALRGIGLDRVQNKIEQLYSSFVSYAVKPDVIVIILAGGLVLQLFRVAYVFLLSKAMGFNVDPAVFFVFVPIISAVMMIPVTVSGIGVREGSYIFLFGYVGLAPAQALGLSALSFALDVTYSLAGGLVYWKGGLPKDQRKT